MINWKFDRTEARIIDKIVDRAQALAEKYEIAWDRQSCFMDIAACHGNGCELKLEELLTADDSTFGHDVFGIRRHINRKTGALEDCFIPRTAALAKAEGKEAT